MAPPPVWTPQRGPQRLAYHSAADVLGFGGAGGGGKTDLILGLAGTQHKRSVIFRRVFPSLRAMIERSREIFNRGAASHSDDSFNESLHVWRLNDGRTIEFGAVQHDADKKKWQGQPHDLIAFDEATEFPESIVRFLMGWNRTTTVGQKCQTVMTFNPPMDEGADWVSRFFAPWVDPEHPRPAADGELRWYAMVKGKEVERPDGAPFINDEGKTVTPKSRTFFHALLKDNPILEATGYGATVDALPEPLRSLLKGNFAAGRMANPFQVIPADWVRSAQARWVNVEQDDHGQQSAVGADISRGGADQTVISPLHGAWFAPLIKYPGISVPDGPTAAGLILATLRGRPAVGVDIIGYGASCYDSLRGAGWDAQGINFAAGTSLTDKSGQLRMRNVRAAAYWLFREALDPENKSEVCLPPDPELLADLCAPRWRLDRGSGRIIVEPKDDGDKAGWDGPTLKERLGRSPDCGDAVVLAWWAAHGIGQYAPSAYAGMA